MKLTNPVCDFNIAASDLQYVGTDLQRPECILAERDGTLWSADARGGVVKIMPDGTQEIITASPSDQFGGAPSEAARYLSGTLPNGLAFARNGDFLIANFGTDCLEVMTRDGKTKVIADRIDGQPIGKVNFVLRDSNDRIWITVSTKVRNWMHALRTDLKDGYIACYRDGDFRIAADGFGFTNEIRFDAAEEYLYVVETTGGCISRLRADDNGNLSQREIFGPTTLGKGAWPDGIAFDSLGNLWGTMVYSDKLFVLTPEGDLRILLKWTPWSGSFSKTTSPRMFYSPPAPALRPGWLALPSAVRICEPLTSDRSRAKQFPISAHPRRACPWFTGTTAYAKQIRCGAGWQPAAD